MKFSKALAAASAPQEAAICVHFEFKCKNRTKRVITRVQQGFQWLSVHPQLDFIAELFYVYDNFGLVKK